MRVGQSPMRSCSEPFGTRVRERIRVSANLCETSSTEDRGRPCESYIPSAGIAYLLPVQRVRVTNMHLGERNSDVSRARSKGFPSLVVHLHRPGNLGSIRLVACRCIFAISVGTVGTFLGLSFVAFYKIASVVDLCRVAP